MASLQKKSLNAPDDTRNFDKGKMQIVNVGDTSFGRFQLEPGWQWSKSVKPIVKTESCQQQHTGYIISGRMKIRMDDGTESEVGPGDFTIIPPGHDAWTVGNEPCVGVDFTGAKTYAK
ncbi:MAG: cupin domain-containing protein [Nitrososphaera sp.]|uniref:cupin domain-containing protein n=1 Tax=Nitrososphaera sp. TaxID=1971748 RepID=UPI003D6F10FD